MYKNREEKNKKPWPENCPWPEPEELMDAFDENDALGMNDEGIFNHLKIKDYFDSLVDEGRLNEDYSLNEDYGWDNENEDEEDEFIPEIGEDYWCDGFDIESWREDLSSSIGTRRIAPMDLHKDPTVAITNLTNYRFTNENLLRQAFTRRAFAIEYGLKGCNEELEFLGDTMLSTVIIKEIFSQFTDYMSFDVETPFQSDYNEGELTKIKDQFVSKEALSARARELGLGDFILYGTGEEETDSALEDMMEALIGAVVIDSNWNMRVVEEFVNKLLVIQFECVDSYLKKSYYEILNTWHQKRFGCIPEYKVYKRVPGTGIDRDRGFPYLCTIKFQVPENDKGIYTTQEICYDGKTRSIAREHTADCVYRFIVENGLWKNLAEAKLVPDFENSVNQLQELYQKKYVDDAPVYEYEDQRNCWYVSCCVESFKGWGKAENKTKAKKKAAYMVLVKMLMSAGICKDEWKTEMLRMI